MNNQKLGVRPFVETFEGSSVLTSLKYNWIIFKSYLMIESTFVVPICYLNFDVEPTICCFLLLFLCLLYATNFLGISKLCLMDKLSG